MVWRLPAAALVALLAGMPLVLLFDLIARGQSLTDPYAPIWYGGVALVAFPVAMVAMGFSGAILHRSGQDARFDHPAAATILGAGLGCLLGLIAVVVVGAPGAQLRLPALGYATIFGATSGAAFWWLYRTPFRRHRHRRAAEQG